MGGSLTVLNLSEATYECIYGRGCDGICCQNGRPPIYPEEKERLDAGLDRILPLLRPGARAVIKKQGYLSSRLFNGLPTARVAGGWCIFFNQGCILHKLGAKDGDKHRYKPAACSLFPLARDEHDQWYVRQFGYKDETWSLFCLDPKASSMPASESMRDEVALAQHYDAEEKAAQRTDGSTS